MTETLADDLRAFLNAGARAGVIPGPTVTALAEKHGCGVEDLIVELVSEAQRLAKPAISGFSAGAVVLGATNAVYLGGNLELRGGMLSDTVHAEQSAVINAWAHEETHVTAIALSAPPCGYCRQFLLETAPRGEMVVRIGQQRSTLLKLLPSPFGPSQLGRQSRLLEPMTTELKLTAPSEDEVVISALRAASASYAPYTSSHAGVALRTAGGIYTGRYVESAAFNPSVSPLMAALSIATLADDPLTDIRRVVLVQRCVSVVGHRRDAERVLESISAAALEVHVTAD